jgi:tRNA A-37 threonylcarbamoyl transferase component Bud32
MAALSPNEFLDWLMQNQFLSETRAQPFRTPPAHYTEAMVLAKELMQRDWLTPYQVNQILQGKGDGLVLGPYRILERLGEGAMGQVYKAWDPKVEQLVAIKMIHREHLDSKKAMERFRREMEAAGQLEHPNIVRLRDADLVENRPFMVMNFIDGTDLSRLVKQDGPLAVWQAAEYARQTALGLQHAFERGVVHRDIKPGNLLVTLGANPVVKISDFGLARFESERGTAARLTQFGAVLGTVDYIAPEQAENAQKADIRADIYGLGCTLYYLLTAQPPFPGATIVEKISARVSGEPTDIHTYRPDVPPGLVAVLKQMVARNPADRYQIPQEVALALEPFCVKEPLAVAVSVGQVGSVPLARPVAASVVAGSGMNTAVATNAFSFSSSDAGANQAAPEAATQPAASIAAGSKPPLVLYALGGGGGLLLLLVLILMLRGCGSVAPPDVYPPNASLAISLKEKTRTLKLGDRKELVFTVHRTNFSGKVDVILDKLPEGISSYKMTINADKDMGTVPINVYQFAQRQRYPSIRLRAVAKNLTAEDWLDLTVVGPEPVQVPDGER